ncbi:hypothetical protein GGH94_000256 [Coemansia aciculifera]|uniref:Uncharacterized protein n=1 Tax=Coemansia aciculifera TaxID=417176 RepID=A0A9W8IUV1_9FUNG|nr:hypothetical protein GGH94_000256 [Coemansia aciculifera]KAJ2877157.1 hypothetical protein GGH93_000186 [Coemansia aciculifera]
MESEHVNSLERVGQSGSSKARRQGRTVSGSATREYGHPYFRDTLHHKTLRQQNSQLRDLDTVREVNSAESAPLHIQLPRIDDGRKAGDIVEDTPVANTLTSSSGDADSMSEESSDMDISSEGSSDSESTPGKSADDINGSPVANSTTAAVVSTQASRQAELPADLSRRSVIRDGLLRQGFSESAIIAYFDQFSKFTNSTYDLVWKAWAVWCVRNDIDPCQQSDADLDTYIMEKTVVESWKIQMRTQVKLVWSIVEGRPPPRERRHLVRRKNN